MARVACLQEVENKGKIFPLFFTVRKWSPKETVGCRAESGGRKLWGQSSRKEEANFLPPQSSLKLPKTSLPPHSSSLTKSYKFYLNLAHQRTTEQE